MDFPKYVKLKITLATLVVSVAFAAQSATTPPPNATGKAAAQMDGIDRAEIEKMLAVELQRSADQMALLPGQKKISISTTLAVNERRLLIDLSRDAVPDKAGAASERQCHEFVTNATTLLNNIVSVNGFTCTYGGKDIFYYHPEPQTPAPAPAPKKKS